MPQKPLPPIQNSDEFEKYREGVRVPLDPYSNTPPTPPAFQAYPQVRGGTEFAQIVDQLMRRVPELRGRADVITHGPDQSSIDEMLASGLNPDEFGGTNLLGITDRVGGRRIAVNPELSGQSAMSTLAHELAHSAGYREEGAQGMQNHLKKGLGLFDEHDEMADQQKRMAALQTLVDAMKKMPKTQVRVSTDEKDKY